MSGQARHALGDPRISWTVLLTASLEAPCDPAEVQARADALIADQGWKEPAPLEVTALPDEIRLAADHRFLDGQAMLTALGQVLARPVRSTASGVSADRTRSGLIRSGVLRHPELTVTVADFDGLTRRLQNP